MSSRGRDTPAGLWPSEENRTPTSSRLVQKLRSPIGRRLMINLNLFAHGVNLQVGRRHLRRARPRPRFVPLQVNPLMELVPRRSGTSDRRRRTALASGDVVNGCSGLFGVLGFRSRVTPGDTSTRDRSRSRDREEDSDD